LHSSHSKPNNKIRKLTRLTKSQSSVATAFLSVPTSE